MEVIQDFLDESKSILDDIYKNMGQIEKLNKDDRQQLVRELSKKIQQIKENIQLSQNELPTLNEQNRIMYSTQIDQLKEQLEITEKQIVAASNKQDQKDRLYEEEDNTIEQGQLTDMNKVQIASLLYQHANSNLIDGNRMLDEIIIINDEITNTLQQDGEKLKGIDNTLSAIDSETQLAKKQLRQLAKRVISNKCYMAMFALVLLVVFGLTIWDLIETVKK